MAQNQRGLFLTTLCTAAASQTPACGPPYGAVESDSMEVALEVKNPPVDAGNLRDAGLIPGSGRFPGGGHGNPLQYSCLENPMDRAAWGSTVHRVTESRT